MYDITHFWDESDQQLRDEGFKNGIQYTVQGMVKIGLSDQQIQDATGLSEEEIAEMRKKPQEPRDDIKHLWDDPAERLWNKGYQKKGRDIVKQMLHLNMDMATICQVTGLSEAEVKAIQEEETDKS